ncbi:hypothetical protein [Dinghuibacter silviterrae]|uniref:Uncharacterized protein n=1 Tax=Dinghuibacter silviterrae TaxID=1539049 RepID=A0A4V3GKL3_9BACT|nr:hypothetical protein [Dinghuibacter silviterrae]TDW96042.1 hypothetical protein EDB95_3864 [Dinghuibacter silviterrae]
MTRLLYIVPFLFLCAAAPVRLKTTWGSQAGGIIDTNVARTVLSVPVTVTDDKGGTYTVTRFRFSFRQQSFYQDSTGKIDTTFRLFSRIFYASTIDTAWSANIAEQVQPGDAFFIDNVIVKDAKGAKALAPDLELDIR